MNVHDFFKINSFRRLIFSDFLENTHNTFGEMISIGSIKSRDEKDKCKHRVLNLVLKEEVKCM